MRWIFVALIVFYRKALSPYYGGGCRYDPSCSEYALESLRRHGAVSGMRLTVRRLLRCRPPFPTGFDPIPARHQIHDALAGRLVTGNQAEARLRDGAISCPAPTREGLDQERGDIPRGKVQRGEYAPTVTGT